MKETGDFETGDFINLYIRWSGMFCFSLGQGSARLATTRWTRAGLRCRSWRNWGWETTSSWSLRRFPSNIVMCRPLCHPSGRNTSLWWERETFYLTTHSTHCIYGYMASDIWLRTILIVRKETRCRHIGYSYRLTARVLLYAPSHSPWYTFSYYCVSLFAAKRSSMVEQWTIYLSLVVDQLNYFSLQTSVPQLM